MFKFRQKKKLLPSCVHVRSFHVVVFSRTAKKCTKMYKACVGAIVLLTARFVKRSFTLPSPSFFVRSLATLATLWWGRAEKVTEI